MKNNRKYLSFQKIALVFTIVFLVVLNGFTVNRSKHLQQTCEKNSSMAENKIGVLKSLNEEFKAMVFNNLHSESALLSPGLLLTNVGSGLKIGVKELTRDGPVLVLRFTEYSCHVCVERELKKIHDLPDTIRPDKFVVFASYENLRQLLLFKEDNHIGYPVYTIGNDSLTVPLETLTVPYFFVLDKELRATNIFYPLTSLPGLTDNYFKILKNKCPDLFK